jgi:hypothetical protein
LNRVETRRDVNEFRCAVPMIMSILRPRKPTVNVRALALQRRGVLAHIRFQEDRVKGGFGRYAFHIAEQMGVLNGGASSIP